MAVLAIASAGIVAFFDASPRGEAEVGAPSYDVLGDNGGGIVAETTHADETTTTYASFSEAVANAADGDTIKLVGDSTIVSSDTTQNAPVLSVGKSITVDLNGHKITGAVTGKNNCLIQIETGATLTVTDGSDGKDGMIAGEIGNYWASVISNEGTFVLKEGTITNTVPGNEEAYSSGYILRGKSNSTFTLDGGELIVNNVEKKTIAGVYVSDSNVTVQIKDGFKASSDSGEYLIKINNADSTLAIDGGRFTANGSGILKLKCTGTITGGEFTCNSSKTMLSGFNFKISGGTFSEDVNDACDAGYISVADPGGETYTVKAIEAEDDAPVVLTYDESGEEKRAFFGSVKAALNYSDKLASDAKGTAVVTVKKDVATGYLSTYNISKLVICDGATLTCDSIMVSAGSTTDRATVENYGTVVTTSYINGSLGDGRLVNNGVIRCGGYFTACSGSWVNNGTIFASGDLRLKDFQNNGTIEGSEESIMSILGTPAIISSKACLGSYSWDENGKIWIEHGRMDVLKDGVRQLTYYKASDAYAYAVANGADTLKLTDDFSDCVLSVNDGNAIIVDLNGHNISFGSSASYGIFTVESGGRLTIADSAAGTDGSGAYVSGEVVARSGLPAVWVKDGGSFTLENGTLKGNDDCPAIYITNEPLGNYNKPGASDAEVVINGGAVVNDSVIDGNSRSNVATCITILGKEGAKNYGDSDPRLIVNGGEVRCQHGIAIIGNGTYNNTFIEITGGKVTSDESIAIYHPQFGILNISGGEIAGCTGIAIKGGDATIAGDAKVTGTGQFKQPSSMSGSGVNNTGNAVYLETNYKRGTTVSISGGAFAAEDGAPAVLLYKDAGGDYGQFAITGGTFSSDVNSSYLKEGYACAGSDGSFVVSASDPVAEVHGRRYATLSDAVDAAIDGDTVKLLKDIDVDDGIVFDKPGIAIALDMDGKTFTVRNGGNINNRGFDIVSGTLNVTGPGRLVAAGSGTTSSDGTGAYGVFRVEKDGTLEASGVTLENSRPWGMNVKVLGGVAHLANVTIVSSYGGGIEVTEAELGEHSKAGSAVLENCTMTQTGYFDHCSSCVSVSGGSSLVVDGGTYTSAGGQAIYVFSSGGKISVLGGTFSGGRYAVVAEIDTATYPGYIGSVKISGGTFAGGYRITSPASLSVSGGTFACDPSAYLAEGYAAVKVGDVYEVRQTFKVTWKNYDGTVLGDAVVPRGVMPVYDKETPVKNADAQYTYAFNGRWTPEVVAVDGDAEYTALFDATVNRYTVTVAAGNHGSVDETSVEANYGTPISTDGCRLTIGDTAIIATPEEANAQYTYAFEKWTPAVEDGAIVTGNATYTASFTATVNKYTVTFDSAGGSDVASATVDYGDVVSMPADPSRDGYTFDGWMLGDGKYDFGTAVVEDVVLVAAWTPKEYTVVFHTADNYYSQTFTFDAPAELRSAGTRAGYAFDGWAASEGGSVKYTDGQRICVRPYAERIDLYAVWTPAVYSISAAPAENGTVDVSPSAECGSTVTVTLSPAEGYVVASLSAEPAVEFSGDEDVRTFTMPASDVAITATFAKSLSTVTWTDWDGTVLETDGNVPYGEIPAYNGAELARESTAQYSYAFSGWNPEPAPVSGDVTYTAAYAETVRTYTVTWKNGDIVLETEKDVPYGTAVAWKGESAPAKESTDEFDYTFTGWDPALDESTTVIGDMEFLAQFESVKRNYDIVFIVDGVETVQNAEYGATPMYDGTPTKEVDVQYTYAFDGWEPEIAAVSGPATYTAVFKQTVNTYVVTWKDWDEKVLKTDEAVPYGETPAYSGADPVRESTAQHSYAFNGWSPEISAVAGDVTYTAAYTETVMTYTVTWKDGDIILATEENVPYGTVVAWKGESAPARGSTAEFDYAFTGWEPALDESTTVTGDMEFLAQFDSAKRSYEITFIVDGTEAVKTVEYGAMPAYDGAPAKDADAQYTYAFEKWEPEIAAVSGPATYTAVFTETLRTYTVTWKDWNGAVLETDEAVPYGTAPTFDGAIPVREPTAEFSYVFDKWTPDVVTVAGDAEYVATYIEIPVSAPEIASIEISTPPEKIAYEIGERFDPAGLAVAGVYADGQKRMLSSSEYTVDAPVLCRPGDFAVAVRYADLSVEFTVSVAAPKPAHDVTENDDGSTTTSDTEVEESEGGTVVVRTETTEHPDGTKTEAKSETAYAPDGSVTETSATSSVSADGATSETSETVKTDASGAEVGRETSVKSSETVKDADGNPVATVTVESVTRTAGGASESVETVAFEAADGGMGTVVESSDGKAKAVTTISAADGMVGADLASGAIAQADDALDRLLSPPESVERTVAVETGAGTSAAFAPEAVKAVAGSGAGLEISGDNGSVSVGAAVCEKLASEAEAKIEIVLTHNDGAALNEVQRDIVGGRHFIDLSALADGVKVHDLGGTAVVEFPYELRDGELAENMAIFYIDDSGAKELVDSVYRDGRFTMETDHFSVFVVEDTAAEPEPEPEDEGGDGGSTLLYAGVAAAAVLIIALAVLLLRRRA